MNPFSFLENFALKKERANSHFGKHSDELDELFSDCSGFDNVKTTLKYFNRKANFSEVVEFRPRLTDRTDGHDYFMAYHNYAFNPQYQTCFKNSYEHFKKRLWQQEQKQMKQQHFKEQHWPAQTQHTNQLNKVPLKYAERSTRNINFQNVFKNFTDYLLEEDQVEIIFPQHVGTEINSEAMDFAAQFQDRHRQCQIVKKLKSGLKYLLDDNPKSEEFILLGVDQIFSTDFVG